MPSLPTEILDLVVRLFFAFQPLPTYTSRTNFFGDHTSVCQHAKLLWADVEPLATSSRLLRTLALELWFDVLVVPAPFDEASADAFLAFPAYFQPRWVRTAYFLGQVPYNDECEVALEFRELLARLRDALPNLSALFMQNLPVPIRISTRRYRRIAPLEGHVMPKVTSLELFHIVAMDPSIVPPLGSAFANLQTLVLCSMTTYCGLCNFSNRLLVSQEPPASLVYTGGEGLPMYFSTALAPLTRLQHVLLVVPALLRASTSSHDSFVVVSPGWTGECGRCSARILAREMPFYAEWTDKKAREPHPPALARVEWRLDVQSAQVPVALVQDDEDDPANVEPDDGDEDADDEVDVDANPNGDDVDVDANCDGDDVNLDANSDGDDVSVDVDADGDNAVDAYGAEH